MLIFIFRKIYTDLNINNIQDKYQFHFDLNETLSYLVYARIIYISSKLETFKQYQSFIEQPIFKLHDEYRALNCIANNMYYIQKELFNNSKKVINKNSRVIVLIISSKLMMRIILENIVLISNINQNLKLI